jgi:hypothetical protein
MWKPACFGSKNAEHREEGYDWEVSARKLSVTKWHNRGDYVKNAKQDMTT